jgi:hypothetical protein
VAPEKNKRRERRPRAFGPVLVRERIRAGLSQRQLSTLAFGSDRKAAHIAAVEAGWILWPSEGFVNAVMVALRLEPEDLAS